ncbi:MAG: TonB-dependent receptor [Bacteroidetes bacterium]|nr:TonB-dependent receptor [Bacteroidota bacterium]
MKKILLILILGVVPIFSQNLSISGTIMDSTGNPLPSVNVILKGTNFGTVSDIRGKFIINNLKPGNYNIEFSSIGYKTKIISNQIINENSIQLKIVLQQQPIESQQVVVTASKYSQKISELPVSADIIHSDEIEKKDITDLQDAMRYVPGVNMVDDQISIRGSSGYSRGAGTRVLLEIDGIPYYTGDTGEIIWEIIPIPEIERVEIIKGAASSLYGSSAIGGVVNVITKDITSKPVTYIKTSVGTYDNPAYSIWKWSNELRTFTGLTVAHSDRINNFGYAVSLTRLSDMSYEQSGFYTRYIGYLKGIYKFSNSSSLTFFANSLNQDHGNFIYWKDSRNTLVPPDADQGERVSSNRYMFGSVYKDILSENLFINVRGSYYRSDWKDQTTSHNNSLSNLFRLEVQANASLSDNLILVSGVEGTTDKVTSNIFNDQSAFGFGVYSQADYKFSFPLSTTFGVRYDFNKLSNQISTSAFSPKAGLNYKLSNKVTLRSSFGTGFRAPTLAEAFTSTTASGITIKPNPNLKPETNWTFEVGANYQVTNFIDFDAAIFQNEYYDFIEPGIDPKDGLAYFANITRARIQGFEFNSNYSFFDDRLKLSLNYTYLWARDLQLHQALKYRPRHMAYARLDYYIFNLDLGADFRYSSKVEQMDFELVNLGVVKDGTKRVEIKVLDLRAGYDLNSFGFPVKVYLNVNNVFNYNYVELIANLAPIRNYSLSAEFLF